MNPGLVVKLRPLGPWRSGPDSGARNRVDPIYHSDSLYAAVTAAMSTLGMRDAWLDATARQADGPAVRFSSCFPFLGEMMLVVPPRSIWPPMGGAPLTTAKVRWKSARFIPLNLVGDLLGGRALREGRWMVDGPSECLLPTGRAGPFRTSVRWSAAVDRLSGNAERHATACLEFRGDAGLWAIVSFANEQQQAQWSEPVRGAFRLLADSGFGGERSRGWGRCAQPEFVEGMLPQLILPEHAAVSALPPPPPPAAPEPVAEMTQAVTVAVTMALVGPIMMPAEVELPAVPDPEPLVVAPPVVEPVAAPAPPPPGLTSHWLLSLFTPDAGDAVDWKAGNYTLIARGGRIDSSAGYGERKKQLQMVAEGSVLAAGEEIRGAAPDVAPDGFAHPVFRAGFALSIRLPEAVTS